MQIRSIPALAATAVLVTACAGPGGPTPDGGLAYDVPAPPQATYRMGDSLEISVNSPMGNMAIERASSTTLAMTFERVGTGVQVTADITDFSASMSNPMGGPITADEGDVEGPLVFVIDARGVGRLTTAPTTSGGASQLSPFSNIANEFFPRLPDRAVHPGDMWVDTVSWSEQGGDADIETTTAYAFTLVGDTVAEGRSLIRVSVSGDVETEIAATQAGMSIEQSLRGTVSGDFLWDVERGILHSSDMERSLAGTLNVVGMGVPSMPVNATGPVRIRLQS